VDVQDKMLRMQALLEVLSLLALLVQRYEY